MMPPAAARNARAALVAACAAASLVAGIAVSAVEPAGARGRPNFAELDKLLGVGDYTAAATAADDIAKQVKPKIGDGDYLVRSIDYAGALKRRGFAELRLARPEAASETFAEAAAIFRDQEFKRLLVLARREAGGKAKPWLVDLELSWIDLFSWRMMALLGTLEGEASQSDPSGGPATADVETRRKNTTRRLEKYESLRTEASEARKSFVDRVKAGNQVPDSPYARALVGPFWTSLLDGLAALEMSRLPPEVLPGETRRREGLQRGDSEAEGQDADERKRLLTRAGEHLEQAAAALREAIESATPKNGVLRPEARIEAALMEVELLAAKARVFRMIGEAASAREAADRVVDLHREVGVLRKHPASDTHPDCFLPLLISAEAALEDSRRLLAAGQVGPALERAEEATAKLERAKALPLADDHPLGRELATLEASLTGQQTAIERSVPRSEAADEAARRLIRALDAAALP